MVLNLEFRKNLLVMMMMMMGLVMHKDQANSEKQTETSGQLESRTINNHHHNQPQFFQRSQQAQQHQNSQQQQHPLHRNHQPENYDAGGRFLLPATPKTATVSVTTSSSIAAALLASADIMMVNKVLATSSVTHNHQNETTTSISDQQQQQHHDMSKSFGDLIVRYVCINLNLVRTMIAQNLVEFLFICVIITYLIYYFSLISRRPKLIGNPRSQFVKLINESLAKTLTRRFSPLIYFWGTNPQTALFGYLQGKSSLHEMPRSAFKRQYLYVSDAQYLMSNVDLTEHYDKVKRKCTVQLQVSVEQRSNLLNQNIRIALDEMLAKGAPDFISRQQNKIEDKQLLTLGAGKHTDSKSENDSQQQVFARQPTERIHSTKKSDRLFRGSSSGSSSDSGVFAGHSSSSSSSSTSSLAAPSDANEDLSTPAHSRREDADQSDESTGALCACKLRYESQPLPLERASSASCKDSSISHNNLLNDKSCSHKEREPLVTSEQLEFGQCALDWHRASHIHYHTNRLVALISAGMTTGSDKKYVTDTVTTLEKLGYEVCVFIRRGVDGLKLSSTRFFSPAKWRDFEAAVQSVRHQRPEAKIVAIGFSFGSIELCRYLSMSGKRSLIQAALLISCPFDPEAGGRNMRKRLLNRRIDAYLAKNLGKQLHSALSVPVSDDTIKLDSSRKQEQQAQQKINNLNGSFVNLSTLPKIKSLVDFEDNYNRVIQNYPNSEAYAADSRLQDHLAQVETPTLCLSSEDDFMAPLKLLPLDQIKANKNICMILTKRGGHMAFIDGLIWPKRPYFAQRIIAGYLAALQSTYLAQPNQSTTVLPSHKYPFAQHNQQPAQDKPSFNKFHQSLLHMTTAH